MTRFNQQLSRAGMYLRTAAAHLKAERVSYAVAYCHLANAVIKRARGASMPTVTRRHVEYLDYCEAEVNRIHQRAIGTAN